ncbi:WXG100 family type VII secretion target [Nocardia halotolerans]|uniref:ESAT-6-like protein n=1 Tax=Nocardia halotolerans TaxID=1755878 RepID=A0ABV8VRP4_9NOCA
MTGTNIDVLGIDKQSQNFEQVHGVLQAAINNIDDEVRTLVPSLWEGDAANAFVGLMGRYQEKAARQQALLMEASGLLNSSSKQFSANDEDGSSKLSSVGSSLDLP